MKYAKRGHGWEGWVGGKVMERPAGKTMPEVLTLLADEAMRRKESLAVIDNTTTNHRIVGWGYTPQGYRDTQNGPKLWLFVFEGDRL